MGRPDSVIEVHYTTRQLAKLLDKEGTQAGGVPRQGHNKPIVRMGGTGLEPVILNRKWATFLRSRPVRPSLGRVKLLSVSRLPSERRSNGTVLGRGLRDRSRRG